jgi:predicted RNase H-like HicB family nuclease
MKKIIQFHIYKSDTHYVAEGVDLPVVTQGKTLDKVTQNLKEAVSLHLEGEQLSDFNLEESLLILA